jgi:hypothetical protein
LAKEGNQIIAVVVGCELALYTGAVLCLEHTAAAGNAGIPEIVGPDRPSRHRDDRSRDNSRDCKRSDALTENVHVQLSVAKDAQRLAGFASASTLHSAAFKARGGP